MLGKNWNFWLYQYDRNVLAARWRWLVYFIGQSGQGHAVVYISSA